MINISGVEIVFSAHRGGGANSVQGRKRNKFPENSLVSLESVMFSDVECVEFDVYKAACNELVVAHDNDLSIIAKRIAQEGEYINDATKQFAPKGTRVPLPMKKFFIEKTTLKDLKSCFDISNGMTPKNANKQEKYKYQAIPTLLEVLHLTSFANAWRKDKGFPVIKLNIELKGTGTGYFVLGVINNFNDVFLSEHKSKTKGEQYKLEKIRS